LPAVLPVGRLKVVGPILNLAFAHGSRLPDILSLVRKLPQFSQFALVILLAWVVSGWMLPSDEMQTSGHTYNGGHSDMGLPELAGLVAVPLFGELPALTQVAPPKVTTPVRSRLTLRLLGTFVAGDASAAIISMTAGGSQRSYMIGDTIQPGVKLKQVEAAAIVVERDGVLERVLLEQGEKLGLASAPVTAQAVVAPRLQRQMNRQYVQQQLQNFPDLMSQARALPYMNNGKLDGFTLSEIAPGSLYQQAGIQNGDVIRKVNGQPITDAGQAMKMYESLKSASVIDIELMRAGQIQHVHYNIR